LIWRYIFTFALQNTGHVETNKIGFIIAVYGNRLNDH